MLLMLTLLVAIMLIPIAVALVDNKLAWFRFTMLLGTVVICIVSLTILLERLY